MLFRLTLQMTIHFIKIKIMLDSSVTGGVAFEKRLHNDWKNSISPYVEALEDKIVIVDGGRVRILNGI